MSEATMTENATQAAAAPEPGPGAALQEERRRQSLSLTDVARQLKLAPRQVEALERDDFAALPGPVFVRGFLRNYARLLGLDPEPMVRTAERLMAPPAGTEGEAVASLERGAAVPVVAAGAGAPRSRWPLYLVSVAVILVTGYLATRDRTPPPSSMDLPVAITPSEPAGQAPASETPAAATPPLLPPGPDRPQASTPAPSAVAPAPETPTPSVPPAAATAPAAPALQAAPSPQVRTAGSAGPAIRMTFSRESWVEVRDRDGNVIFGQLNPAGSIRVVRGQPPLSVVVGNASAVSLTYNGKTVDLAPHTRTDVARLTLE